MKFAMAAYGTRGDLEPCLAVGRELLRRGHEVHMAVPPDLEDFVASTGITVTTYGPNVKQALERDFLLNLWMDFPRNLTKVRHMSTLYRETHERFVTAWPEMAATVASVAQGADVLVTGLSFEQQALPVAEYYGIPLVALHPFPVRPNGQVPFLPAAVMRSALKAYEWVHWLETKKLEDAHRRELGLPRAKKPAPRMMAERDTLEIQAFDSACFPGLSDEWQESRPIVGTLTLDLTTDADDDVMSWIAAGSPPIYFGFGSIPVQTPDETLEMISAACRELGERALVCSGWSDFVDADHLDHVKVVNTVSHVAVFPLCRALVHHGGLGTTATGLRAGVPTLILWTLPDVHARGAVIRRQRLGATRRLATSTKDSLVADLRTILAPDYATRAREFATTMTKSTEGIAAAADLVESRVPAEQVG
jgi:UDP:flavonoid glycosyltransferase YjiC (YdhE family)